MKPLIVFALTGVIGGLVLLAFSSRTDLGPKANQGKSKISADSQDPADRTIITPEVPGKVVGIDLN